MSQLESIRIVLAETFHPGNIGAAARAMKTMGLENLVLVNPSEFPHSEATSRAAGASDLLENVRIETSLKAALSDCQQVFATSARKQHAFGRPQQSCEEAVEWVKNHSEIKIAIVFGPERTGLSAEDIQLCDRLLYIPGNPQYDVLNMAAAVQIVCYELHRQISSKSSAKLPQSIEIEELANKSEIEGFYEQLETLLKERGYIRDSQPTDTMKKLSHMFNKTQMTSAEVSMMRGVIKALTRQKQA